MGPNLRNEFEDFAIRIYEQTGCKVLNFTLDSNLFDMFWNQISTRIQNPAHLLYDSKISMFNINTSIGTITFEREYEE